MKKSKVKSHVQPYKHIEYVMVRDESPEPPVKQVVIIKANPQIKAHHICSYDAKAAVYRLKYAGEAG